MSYARTCTPDTKLPGTDGAVEVELEAGSLYVMAGISRYGLKHGVLDASSRGDRVSLTFREVAKPSDPEGLRRWRRNPADIVGPAVKHPAALGCSCCRAKRRRPDAPADPSETPTGSRGKKRRR